MFMPPPMVEAYKFLLAPIS